MWDTDGMAMCRGRAPNDSLSLNRTTTLNSSHAIVVNNVFQRASIWRTWIRKESRNV